MDLQYGWVGGWKLCKQTVDPTHWRICSLPPSPPSVWCQRPRSQFVTGMKEVCESSRLSFSPRKTRPGERPSGSCLVTCSSILFIYFLPSSIDLRLSLTHCHRAADHHLTFFSSQIYTKYWIFSPLRSHDNSLQNMVLTRQSSASIPVALPFLEDEIRVRSLGDP